MPWEIEYVPSKEMVVVAASGILSDKEATQLTRHAIALVKETQATRVLGDWRKTESGPSFGAVYWLVREYANDGVPRETRIALVHSTGQEATELARFFENVCFNQRYEAKAFHSRAAAEAWLCSYAPAWAA